MWHRANILLCNFFRKFKKVILTLSYKPKTNNYEQAKNFPRKTFRIIG